MRLGVFLLFFAIILATVSAPVAAQPSPPGPPDVEKPVKKVKPPKKAKKPPPGAEEGDPDGEEGDPVGEEGDPVGEEGDPVGEEGDLDGEEGDLDGEQGGTDGGIGQPRIRRPEGARRRGSRRPGSIDRRLRLGKRGWRESSLASQTGCSEDCDPPSALTDRLEGDAILSAADAEPAGAFEDDGLSFDAAADASPPVLALFALMGLGLLAGLAGGLRALHGRISGDG